MCAFRDEPRTFFFPPGFLIQENIIFIKTIANNTDADITTWFCHLIDEAIEKNKIKRKLTVQEVKTCWNAITQSRSEKELLNLAKEYLYS